MTSLNSKSSESYLIPPQLKLSKVDLNSRRMPSRTHKAIGKPSRNVVNLLTDVIWVPNVNGVLDVWFLTFQKLYETDEMKRRLTHKSRVVFTALQLKH